jgi:ferric-dicitrate binding protein FerR (iron transport regulator)
MKIDQSNRAEALSALRESQVPLEDAADAEARARRMYPRLSAAIRAVPARRRAHARRKLAMGVTVAAAAAALIIAMVGRNVRPPREIDASHVAAGAPVAAPTAVVPAPTETVPEAESVSEAVISDLAGDVEVHRAAQMDEPGTPALSLHPADEVATRASGRSRITMSNGARVKLSGNTRVRLQDGASQPSGRDRSGIVLAAGKVDVQVPKLNGRSFVVTTPHAEVVVHGTAFSVEVLEPDARPGETCVVVTEGSVSVHSAGAEVRLGPSGRWSSLANASRCDGKPAPRRTNPLALQNSLFQTAITAVHRGDDREAVRLLDELLQKFPDSPLAPEAKDLRKRALERLRETPDPPE